MRPQRASLLRKKTPDALTTASCVAWVLLRPTVRRGGKFCHISAVIMKLCGCLNQLHIAGYRRSPIPSASACRLPPACVGVEQEPGSHHSS